MHVEGTLNRLDEIIEQATELLTEGMLNSISYLQRQWNNQ